MDPLASIFRAGVAGDPSGGKGFRDLEKGKAKPRICQSLGTGSERRRETVVAMSYLQVVPEVFFCCF